MPSDLDFAIVLATAHGRLTRRPSYAQIGETRIRIQERERDASMHILDGMLSPQVAAGTGVVAAVGFRAALARAGHAKGDRATVLMGVLAAFLFAAQMVNFPAGPGVSGHLLGGVLAAVVLGPWAGAVVVGAVLIVQCLLFSDGGVTALGANFLNMGLIGAVGGYAIYAPIRQAIGGKAGVLLGAMAAAWLSTILTAGAFAAELALSGRAADFPRILGWMTMVHAAIGVGEAIITGLVLRFVLLARPDLIYEPAEGAPSRLRRTGQVAVVGLAVALAIAVVLGPLASDAPDGLEFVGQRLGFLPGESRPVLSAPIPDYNMPGLTAHVGLATAAAGLVGTLVVFATGLVLARAFAAPKVALDEP
jgi:cobalt/nickel transport system permease protein